jgi:hypothetical protein
VKKADRKARMRGLIGIGDGSCPKHDDIGMENEYLWNVCPQTVVGQLGSTPVAVELLQDPLGDESLLIASKISSQV